jgi:hypothetical protein
VSVLMILRVATDAGTFERVAAENADTMKGISGRGKERGAIHHAFYEGDGEVLVIDEWDSAESFQAFFDEVGPNIGPLIAATGADGPSGPPTFYRKLDTADAF